MLRLLFLCSALAVPVAAQQALPPPEESVQDLEAAAAEQAAAGQTAEQAAAQQDSGLVVGDRQERVPLEMFMVPKTCDDVAADEICITGRPPEEEAPVPKPLPGDRKLDVVSERNALANMGADRLPTECGAPIGPATTGCNFDQYGDYDEEKELLDEQYLPPEPE